MTIYNNSPIIESICEFRFTEDTNWDITVPGLIFEDVRTEYPYKEQRTTQEISLSPIASGSNKATGQSELPRPEGRGFPRHRQNLHH
jgi:uncharacterized protein (TIGR04255 family)